MKYWLTTRWPAAVEPNTASAPAGFAESNAPINGHPMHPPDTVLIYPFQPGRPLLKQHRPRREPLGTRWPATEGAVVIARVVGAPADATVRGTLHVDRDPACWIRILEMKLPNFSGFAPHEEVERILGVGDGRRIDGANPAAAGLFRLSEPQFNRLLRLFSTRQANA